MRKIILISIPVLLIYVELFGGGNSYISLNYNFRGIQSSDKLQARSGSMLYGLVFSANKLADFVIESGITFNRTYSYPELINTYSSKVVTSGQANVYSSKQTYSEIQIPLQFMYHFQLMNKKKIILKSGPMLSLNTSVWSMAISEKYEVLSDNTINRNLPSIRNQFNPAIYPGIGGVLQANYQMQKGDLIFSARFQFLDGAIPGNFRENYRTTIGLGYRWQ